MAMEQVSGLLTVSPSPIQFKAKTKPQIIASVVATLGPFCSGTVLGWTSTANPNLKESKDLGDLSDSQLSWVASIAVVGALISGFATGVAIEKIGRRLTMLLLVIPFVLGWTLMVFANTLAMMLAGRFITGFCLGAYTLVVPVYIAEITEDKLRGTMASFMVVMLVTGVLFEYVVGAFVSWRWQSGISGVIPIVFAVLMFFMPDTPRYLLANGNRNGAISSLQWLRGAPSFNEIDSELKDIQTSIDEDSETSTSIRDLLQGSTVKPVGICIMLMVFQQFGGINAVIFFTVDIFKASGSNLDANVASIIVGTVQVVFVIVSTLLVEKAGRKILMVISEIGMTVSLFALGLFFYLKSQNKDVAPEGLGWLPLVSMILYIITYNLGCASLPWALMGELCPSHIKGAASALVTSTCWFLAFVVTYTFADLKAAIGDHSVFWIFSGFSALGTLFCIFILPETKGRSLDEIQLLFGPKQRPVTVQYT